MKKTDQRKKLIGQFKAYLNLQFEAYEERDWELYDKLESRLETLERQLS